MAKRIFVVDDERRIADTLAIILRNSGYEARAFYDAESALHHFDFLYPDLLISDVVMPGMNGVQLAILVRERYPTCRILLFSGQAFTANILKMAGNRGHKFELLEKPIRPTELLSKVRSLEDDPGNGPGMA